MQARVWFSHSVWRYSEWQRFICQSLNEVTSERVFFSGHESCRWNSENMTKGFFPPKVFLPRTWDNGACLLYRKSIYLPISVHKFCNRYVSSNSSSRHVGPLWTPSFTISRPSDKPFIYLSCFSDHWQAISMKNNWILIGSRLSWVEHAPHALTCHCQATCLTIAVQRVYERCQLSMSSERERERDREREREMEVTSRPLRLWWKLGLFFWRISMIFHTFHLGKFRALGSWPMGVSVFLKVTLLLNFNQKSSKNKSNLFLKWCRVIFYKPLRCGPWWGKIMADGRPQWPSCVDRWPCSVMRLLLTLGPLIVAWCTIPWHANAIVRGYAKREMLENH